MGQAELGNAYSIQPTFLEALALRNYVPIHWRRALTRDFMGDPKFSYNMVINNHKFDLMDSGPKAWYSAVINTKRQEIKRQQSWKEELSRPDFTPQPDWANIYSLPYKITRETKLQSFQFRIAHRLITCNRYRRTLGMHPDGRCDICSEVDTLTHFFTSCIRVRNFWQNLDNWSESHLGFGLAHLSAEEKILGFTEEGGNPRQFKLLNWLLITGKFYIHRCRLFHNGQLSLLAYLAELKNKLRVEKRACWWEQRRNKFKPFERLFQILNP